MHRMIKAAACAAYHPTSGVPDDRARTGDNNAAVGTGDMSVRTDPASTHSFPAGGAGYERCVNCSESLDPAKVDRPLGTNLSLRPLITLWANFPLHTLRACVTRETNFPLHTLHADFPLRSLIALLADLALLALRSDLALLTLRAGGAGGTHGADRQIVLVILALAVAGGDSQKKVTV